MQIYRVFPEGKTKVLTLSYDDGKLTDEKMISIMNHYGIKGTFNLNFSVSSSKNIEYVPLDRVQEVYKGHEVATHTYSHITIARCPATQIYREIFEDKKGWESIMNVPVRGHSYPYGSFSEEVKHIFQNAGIVYARTTNQTLEFELPKDWMEWDATCRHNNPQLMELAKRFVESAGSKSLKLMYVWGHSNEFKKENNWEILEEFCKYVGGREDIWYATNIEIKDYLDAYDRLQFAADESFVYNPSVIDVWVSVGKNMRPMRIPGGSKVVLNEVKDDSNRAYSDN